MTSPTVAAEVVAEGPQSHAPLPSPADAPTPAPAPAPAPEATPAPDVATPAEQANVPAVAESLPSPAPSPSHGARPDKHQKWKNYHNNGANGHPNGGANNRQFSKNNPPPPTNCVVLKNLDYNITQPELEEVVRQVTGGRKNFLNVTLLDDKATGTFRGMAFVNFHSVADASAALTELAKMVINGRKVIAEYRRLRPGELERKEAKEKAAREAREAREAKAREAREQHEARQREAVEAAASAEGANATTDGGDDAANGSADPEASPNPKNLDKRALFFATRENAREFVRDTKREISPEQMERDKAREAEFRKLLLDYAGGNLEEGEEVVKPDLVFDSSLTSYERRMVHMICTELGLGHVSRVDEEGNRALHVTKDLERANEWEKEAAAAGQTPNQKKKEKKGKENGHGGKQKYEPAKSDMAPLGDPISREERAGIKWFKPKAAKNGDAEGDETGTSGIKMPKFKVYTPERQPTGPDGSIGFATRCEYHGVTPKRVEERAEDVVDENVNTSEGVSHNYTPKKKRNKKGGNKSESAQAQPNANGDATPKDKESKKPALNPSVPAFSPVAPSY